MLRFLFILFSFLTISCASTRTVPFPKRTSNLTGTEFYSKAAALAWKQRDSFATKEILAGNIPNFLSRFQPINIFIIDSISQKRISATFYASPDYLSIGTDEDWARIPLTPMAAQMIADETNCFLPTRKLVDDIYKAATVKLSPIPMYAFRDSTVTMFQHHLIIEGQRKGRKGMIAGIKKDIVISSKVSQDKSPDREAIYGWHKSDGSPIQPLYTGHINWYVDYSHGIRFIYRKIKVNGKWMDYEEVMNHPSYKRLLCDEVDCSFLRYAFSSP